MSDGVSDAALLLLLLPQCQMGAAMRAVTPPTELENESNHTLATCISLSPAKDNFLCPNTKQT